MSKNIAVIFGGVSSEHEISKASALNVLKNLSKEKYNTVMIGVTRNGKYINYRGRVEDIKTLSWESHPLNKEVIVSFTKGFMTLKDGKLNPLEIDVVFPVLHGKDGEDGKLQALLEILKIPFVGCDSTSSSNCMDKIITDILLEKANIKKANSYYLNYNNFSKEITLEIEKKLGSYPMFVKPSRSGSSVGVSKVKNKSELLCAIEVAAKEDKKILIQENIEGKELECAVLGNSEPIASVVGEVFVENGFYDFNSKYLNNSAKLFIPARVEEDVSNKVKSLAILVYKTLGCSGFSRVDFFLRHSDKEIIVNEVNTIPGFTDISMYPKLMEKIGIATPRLLDKLIDFALNKHLAFLYEENVV